MPEYQQHRDAPASGSALRQPGQFPSDRPGANGRQARWSDCLRMIAVTAEQLSTASAPAETSGYVPTVPADSDERSVD